MAPSRPKKTARVVEPALSDEEEAYTQSQPDASQQSQEIDMTTLSDIVNKTKQQNAKRKQQRENQIEKTRQERLGKIQKKIRTSQEAHEKELKTLRQPHIKRLRELLQKKIDIEAQMDDCVASIHQVWGSTLEQTQVAVEDCIEDVSDDESFTLAGDD